MSKNDEIFMKQALRLAKKGVGRTSPNPMVGAVIVRKGMVIASGYHRQAGHDHAEVEALRKMKGRIMPGDTLYVTLEPCNHYGKTPPCTEAILKSGLKRVRIGMLDPNPGVSGGGATYLREKGVDVKSGILGNECEKLNESYIKSVTSGRPFVIAKSALTLDGWTATSTGNSKWITNEKSRRLVHRLRDRVDGILVGVGTVIQDDPLLTARLQNKPSRDPVRIIVDTHLRIQHNAQVIEHDSDSMTIIAVGDMVSGKALKDIERERVSTLVCPTRADRVDLTALMEILGRMSLTSLLLEGGSTLMGSMIRERLIDKFYIFKAPRILGGDDGFPLARGRGPERIDESLTLTDIKVRRLGDDILIRGYPVYGKDNEICLQD